jgi:hypothetical protein
LAVFRYNLGEVQKTHVSYSYLSTAGPGIDDDDEEDRADLNGIASCSLPSRSVRVTQTRSVIKFRMLSLMLVLLRSALFYSFAGDELTYENRTLSPRYVLLSDLASG